MHMLQNFTSTKEGNAGLKNQLSGFTSRRTVQAKEDEKVQKPILEKHEIIDYAVSKKANKFFSEEVRRFKKSYLLI